MKFFLSIFLINIIFFNISLASNIVYLDLDYILNNSNSGKKIIYKLNEANKRNLELLKEEEKKLNLEKNEIDKTRNIISEAELTEKIKILNSKFQNFTKKQEVLSNEFKNLRNKEINNLLEKINPIIEKYMLDNNIDMVLKKENFYISKSEFDVSKRLILLIDKNINN